MKQLMSLFMSFALCVSATAQSGSFVFNGLTRTYTVHLPPGFSDSDTLPVVFSLHGLGMNAQSQSDLSQFNPIADRERFIAVYPNGNSSSWNTFNVPYTGGIDDVGFLSALIDTLHSRYHIDLNRVYSCGMSNGGFMSYRLACQLSHRIAAIASVTGSMVDSMVYYCNPARPFPILHIHGTSDAIVNYNGAASFISVDSAMSYWVNHNNCPTPPQVTQVPDINATDQTTVSKIYWAPCNGQTEVIHYKVQNGGHTWAGNPENFFGVGGNVNLDLMGSEVIWEFFSQYTLQGKVAPVSARQPAVAGISFFPNPVQDALTVRLSRAVEKTLLTDVSGKIVLSQNTRAAETVSFQMQHLAGGMYFLICVSAEGVSVFKISKT